MEFTEFPEQNQIIAKDHKQYKQLPAYVTDNPNGEIICKVSVSDEELEQIRENGGFWLSMWTFGNGVTPIRCFTETPFRSLFAAKEMTAEVLRDQLKENSRIGNFHIGRDVYLIEIMKLQAPTAGTGTEPIDLYWKMINPTSGDTLSTHAGTFKSLSEKLSESNYHDQWFIIN